MQLLDRLLQHDAWTTRQLLYLLRLLGVEGLLEGDVLSWENQAGVK